MELVNFFWWIQWSGWWWSHNTVDSKHLFSSSFWFICNPLTGEYWLQDIQVLEKQVRESGGGPPGSDAYVINGHLGPFHNCSNGKNSPKKDPSYILDGLGSNDCVSMSTRFVLLQMHTVSRLHKGKHIFLESLMQLLTLNTSLGLLIT